MKLSIIIPTLNEEHFLPNLLECIRLQKFKDFEVIVADSNSRDATRKIAESFGCKIVEGGSPAVGRNNGAKAATGDLLFFLDADVVIEDNFFEPVIREFEENNYDIASTYMTPLSDKAFDRALHKIANICLKTTQKVSPHAPGFCILVKRDLHEKIGGFRNLKTAEDHDYVKRAGKVGKFALLVSKRISVSVRRFEKEGRLKIAAKYFYVELYRLLKGEVEHELFSYEFGQFGNESVKKSQSSFKQVVEKFQELKKQGV